VRGKKAKAIRKAIALQKETEASESGLEYHYPPDGGRQLRFRQRSNPQRCAYRRLKEAIQRAVK